nr:type 1 glutamine amidotransferase domain-containing protein [uncultured Bdellovibrio sp.]
MSVKKVLIPLPGTDFDPTESAVPWRILTKAGVQVVFATPDGKAASCDPRMISGKGLGPLAKVLVADKNGQAAYRSMIASAEFVNPISWKDIKAEDYDGVLLPGGHAPGMKEYLESKTLQSVIVNFFEMNKLVGAICHGVVLASRSVGSNGHSVLWGRATTALLKSQELLAWSLTCLWLKDYYRTYPQTVEDEVTASLRTPADFQTGSMALLRDSAEKLNRGFVVEDRNYLSARWPGDAHLFATKYLQKLLT